MLSDRDLRDVKVVVFDLDGTLTDTGELVDYMTARLLYALIPGRQIAVISGASFGSVLRQLESFFKLANFRLDYVTLIAASGNEMYSWNGEEWTEFYRERLGSGEALWAIGAILAAMETMDYDDDLKSFLTARGYFELPKEWGKVIVDRGGQITFTALGHTSPAKFRREWDPDLSKRKKMVEVMKPRIPKLTVKIGGASSIDVTLKGRDKGFGILKLSDYLNIPLSRMLFIGDNLMPDGNDYPIKEIGVECVAVNSSEDTKKIICRLIAS